MAERRMFTKKVTDDDNFMALSSSAQALYLHLSMSADDDGFCNQVSVSMFKAHASVADLQQLLEKRYIYQFDNGVIVIKHWRMANALRKDRYTPTNFKEELAKLKIKSNGAYTFSDVGCQVVANGLPDGCQMVTACLPQDSIGKDSIDKNRIGKDSIGKDNNTKKEKDVTNVTSEKKRQIFNPPSVEQVEEYCLERNNGIDAQSFVDFYDSKGWMIGKNKMKDWKAAVRTWERSRAREKEPQRTVYDEWRES